jgi:hypothetical protein
MLVGGNEHHIGMPAPPEMPFGAPGISPQHGQRTT